tara:strand:+ start:53 stop:904 length:852 start_codon:yes stop_codon:yes gene_type:complete
MLKDITVTIPTLNEEKNIKACIESVKKSGIKNIIVIDGGSEDKTLKILKKINKIKVFKVKRKGLAFQRKLGVIKAKTKFIALIDADMRPTKNSFKIMLKDINKKNYAGIEAHIKSDKIENYFDKAYQQIMEININKTGPRNMIGTPTLWHSKILKKYNFDPFFTGPSDDTDLCYRIYKNGYVFGSSNAIIKHVHRSNLNEYTKKYLWYGKGDAQFIIKHPERTLNILIHQLFNYPIKFSFLSILRGKFYPIPFMFFSGYLRFIGMLYEILKISFRFKDKIYST